MKLVVKIGGHGAEDPKGRKDLARQIAAIHKAGHSVVVVHGGGKVLTRTLERMGIATEFHQGLRVTDAATRDVAMMVLAGLVNKQWVADLESLKQPALGLCGGDGSMVLARKLSVGSNGSKRDLGFVGRPHKVKTKVLDVAMRGGMIPVVASLGLDAHGEFLNINADDLAAALAVAIKADRLLYLTEAGGVWDAEKKLLPVVKLGDINRMIKEGAVRDGMIPKLLSCARTLRQNVGEVVILSTTVPNALVSAIKKGENCWNPDCEGLMNLQQIADLEKRVLIPTYERLPILAVQGDGCYVEDDTGKKYLDFLGGLAVNSLGYNHPEIMATVRDSAESLLHVSNLLYHPFQAPLAEKLTRLSGMDRAFFANSGTEGIEGAMKLSRAYARKHAGPGPFERYEILAVENSFHGRTFGALSATWPKKYREPFEPLPPGVRFVHLDDVADLRENFTPKVAAVMVEVIQGEGGVVEVQEDFLKAAAELCRQHGALLICDEIQCGLGRTGRFFAYSKFGLKPDIVVVSKPLAAGLPLAAILAREEVAQAFSPGMHGTTFGGGPLQCRVALKVLEILERPEFLPHVAEVGAYFRQELEKLRAELPVIRQVRGDGLIVAAELETSGKPVVQQALKAGLLLNCTQDKVLRFLPPLIIEKRHVDEAIGILKPVLAGLAPATMTKGVNA